MREVLTLTRLNLQVKRGYLTAWILPLWLLLGVFPPAYQSYYPTLESRQEMIDGLISNAGTTAIYGRISEPGTIGQMTTWEMGSWLGLLGSVMTVLLIVSLHRQTEHNGIGELQRSAGIRATTPAMAAILSTVVVSFILGAGATIILLAEQAIVEELTVPGGIAFGVSIMLVTLGSALLAQLVLLGVRDSAAFTRVGLVTIGLAFTVRVVSDVERIDWLNWLSPLGWRELIDAYDADNFATAGILALVCLVAIASILIAENRRSFQNPLIHLPRRANTRTRPIHGPLGLRWSQSGGAVLTWIIVVVAISTFLLSISGSIQELVAGEGATGEVFRDLLGGTAAYELFISYITQIVALLIAAAGLGLVATQVSEENAGTVDLQRATGIRRWSPLGATTALAGGAVLLMVVALHAGGALGLYTQDSTQSVDYTTLAWATWSQLGPTLLFTGLAVALVGLRPTWMPIAWLALGFSGVTSLMGEILQLPQWVIDASPFSHTQVGANADWWTIAAMVGLGSVFTVIGLVGARSREIR